jgi:hypothetical protein
MPLAEHTALVEDLSLSWTGLVAGDQVNIPTPLGPVTGRPEIYRPLLAMLENGPVSIRQIRATQTFAQRPLLELLQAVALLIGGGYAHPVLPGGASHAGRAASAGLNRAIAAANVLGADMPRVVVPAIGSVFNVDLLETLLVGELLAGKPAELESLTTAVLGMLEQSGRAVQRDGQPVSDAGQARTIVMDVLRSMLERRVPMLRGLGVLEG